MGTHLVCGHQLTFNFAGTILPEPRLSGVPQVGKTARQNQFCQTHVRVKLLNDELEICIYIGLFNMSLMICEH